MTRATGLLCAAAFAAGAIPVQAQSPQGQYVPLKTPCRVFDSRLGDPPQLVTDTIVAGGSTVTKVVNVRGTCGIPRADEQPGVGSLAYNLTVAGLSGQRFYGHMTVYPADLPGVPLFSSINFSPYQNIANGWIVRVNRCPLLPLNTTSPDGCRDEDRRDGDIVIHLFLANGSDGTPSIGSKVNAVLDVAGFFRP